jgi:cyclopropane fatty-acyl-phospholipid synthase-like methyltransferase
MIEKKIIKKYNEGFDKYGSNDRRSIFWTKDKQDMRFNILLDSVYKMSGMTLLDYGCGFADLKSYLIKNFFNIKYSGCDINRNFINVAKNNFPEDDIFLINTIDDITKKYDIILASGTFNLLGIHDSEKMKEYVFKQIKKLFDKTNHILVVNFLSHLTDKEYRYDGHFYLNPIDLYNYSIKNMTRRVIIDNASLPYEITMKFYKDQTIDKHYTIYESSLSNEK